MQLLYREYFLLHPMTPSSVRHRIMSMELLGETKEALALVCTEVSTAFVQHGQAPGFTFRLYSIADGFRVELVDSLISEQTLTRPQDQAGRFRLALLDAATDDWGVLGDGTTAVWIEVSHVGKAAQFGRDQRESEG